MKVPEEELLSDILKRLTGESALPVYSNIEKLKRGKDGLYFVAEDFNETVKKRELVNAKERLRVSVHCKIHRMNHEQGSDSLVTCSPEERSSCQTLVF